MHWDILLAFNRPGQKTGKNEFVEARSAFERDYDRIIFSHPFRRLQDKTQVFPLPRHDFVHTRLTHSLEVSSVGRSLGKRAGEQIIKRHPELIKGGFSQFDFGAIVAAACLAHDLGNPPFGHSGESALSDFFLHNPEGQQFRDLVSEPEWEDLIHFEGNAQGFRILNKPQYQGLRLTYATLAAFTKYPCESLLRTRDKKRSSQKKFGFYQTEREVFQLIARETHLKPLAKNSGELSWFRHPLAFLVEAADDICYHIIDLEDGCRLNLINFDETRDLLAKILGGRYRPEKLSAIKDQNEKIGVLRAVAINELIGQATEAFLDQEAEILKGGFDRSLINEVSCKNTLEEIIEVSVKNIYKSRMVLERETGGFRIIEGILEALIPAIHSYYYRGEGYTKGEESMLQLLPGELKAYLTSDAKTLYGGLRMALDYVSGLTDRHAVDLYRTMSGISLPGFD